MEFRFPKHPNKKLSEIMEDNKKYLNQTMDEIVFDNRNKSYGAFFLRHLTKRNTVKALIFIFCLSSVLTGFSYVGLGFLKKKSDEVAIERVVTLTEPPPLDEEAPPPLDPLRVPRARVRVPRGGAQPHQHGVAAPGGAPGRGGGCRGARPRGARRDGGPRVAPGRVDGRRDAAGQREHGRRRRAQRRGHPARDAERRGLAGRGRLGDGRGDLRRGHRRPGQRGVGLGERRAVRGEVLARVPGTTALCQRVRARAIA